jgi:predicted HAD superfamily Cof-like phosphohydrolase
MNRDYTEDDIGYDSDFEIAMAFFADFECSDVYELHAKFGFTRSVKPRNLPVDDMLGRYRFLLEEVTEFKEAVEAGDMAKMFDALLDIVYVAKGTAIQLGFPWSDGWDEVQRANMAKEVSPVKSNRGGHDLLKPPGWKPPDIEGILADHINNRDPS